uniref:type II toxin-antitoxin system Phd/YefM family antitoxin n=1 Tax=Streptosporangium roseum TaxID=2001 RepID=UPI002F34F3DA
TSSQVTHSIGSVIEALSLTVAVLYSFLYSFCMTVLHDATELTVTEAAQRGVARLVADAERGADLVVTRRHQPVAAVVSMRRLNELEEAAVDLRDLALVLVRAATDSGRRTPLDDVLSAFGHTRESLAALTDDDE